MYKDMFPDLPNESHNLSKQKKKKKKNENKTKKPLSLYIIYG